MQLPVLTAEGAEKSFKPPPTPTPLPSLNPSKSSKPPPMPEEEFMPEDDIAENQDENLTLTKVSVMLCIRVRSFF